MNSGAFTVAVDRPRRVIHARVFGPLSDTVLAECSRVTRLLPEFKEGFGTLLDLTEISTVNVSSAAIMFFGRAAQKDVNRVAILTDNITAFGFARIYEIIADVGEHRVHVFNDEGAALEWIQGA
jgi:hypothetical protein